MRCFTLSLICCLASGCGYMGSGTTSQPTTPTTSHKVSIPDPSPTNTGINARDRSDETMTPFDQNENSTDIAITADIRKRIVGSTMSISANNTKIMTKNGKVTLRGPVATADEKAQIDVIAKEVAGTDNVDNQLDVSSKPSTSLEN